MAMAIVMKLKFKLVKLKWPLRCFHVVSQCRCTVFTLSKAQVPVVLLLDGSLLIGTWRSRPSITPQSPSLWDIHLSQAPPRLRVFC